MRVCDGSCRRLARLCGQSQAQAELIAELAANADACSRAGHADWAALMQRAAAALRRSQETCSDDALPPEDPS